jgi:hypothetical protein
MIDRELKRNLDQGAIAVAGVALECRERLQASLDLVGLEPRQLAQITVLVDSERHRYRFKYSPGTIALAHDKPFFGDRRGRLDAIQVSRLFEAVIEQGGRKRGRD